MELALHTPPTNFHMACNYCSTLRRCLFCILSWRGARVSGRTVCSEQHSLLPESLRVFFCPHSVLTPRLGREEGSLSQVGKVPEEDFKLEKSFFFFPRKKNNTSLVVNITGTEELLPDNLFLTRILFL